MIYSEWEKSTLNKIEDGLLAPTAGMSRWYHEATVEGGHLVVTSWRQVEVTVRATRPARWWRGADTQVDTRLDRQYEPEVRIPLPERVVRLPLPSWTTFEVYPGFETEVWNGTPGPTSAPMFLSEALAAAEKFRADLESVLEQA